MVQTQERTAKAQAPQVEGRTPPVPTGNSSGGRGGPVPAPAQATRYLWAITRLCMGWVFLWPFLDKTFGLGHETSAAHAWIRGGSPSF